DASAVAVIGMAGRFPQAANLEAYWRNLLSGRVCIEEIPPQRWPLEGFYDADPQRAGASYSKWGGFIDGVDRFDALFFNISPEEAARMDPQERLFLEVAWQCLEDAGLTRAALGAAGERDTAVYVGVMYGDYQLLAHDAAGPGQPIGGAAPYWSIANRASYVLGLEGPSLAVDSACSSSLTALHLACQALAAGDCRTALVGGVNLSLHPSKYIGLSQGRFASSDGRCRSFGDGGDGYVPGEGV
ncbi:polyketide synthase, partial [Methylogaea oryzae]